MNRDAIQAVLLHSRSANAARMVLMVIAAHSGEQGRTINLPISQIMAEANASERTVKYAIEELRDKLKEVLTERNGTGRGSTFDFDLSPLFGRAPEERVQDLHASDKRAEVAPIPTEEPAQPIKGADSAPIACEKGANIHRKGAESAPLSDSKGANFTGTPVAPYSAKELLSTTGAKAPSPRARRQTPEIELPEWLPVESWHEWEEHRREIKKPLTALSVKKQIKQLAEFRARGMPPEKIIDEAITHGWRCFYPLKDETNGNGNGTAKQAQRTHGAGKQLPRTPEPVNREWPVKNRV